MNKRHAILAAAFSAVAFLSLPSPATAGGVIEDMPPIYAHLDRSVHLEQDALGNDGKRLTKGTYDLRIESLGNGKVKVSFFQGGVRKGEANGIIVIGGAQASGRVGPGSPPSPIRKRVTSFADLGLDANSRAACFPPIGTIGTPGGNQIKIDLPAAPAQNAAPSK